MDLTCGRNDCISLIMIGSKHPRWLDHDKIAHEQEPIDSVDGICVNT